MGLTKEGTVLPDEVETGSGTAGGIAGVADVGGTSASPDLPAATVGSSPDGHRRAAKTAVVIILYTALAVAFFHPIWTTDPRTVMQAGGDQDNFVWFLDWVPWAILHGHSPFSSNFINYPGGVNLLTNAGVVGLGVLFSPITLLAGPVASFNAVETLSMAASAIGAYFLVLRYVRWRPAAFVAGLVYGFSPFMRAEIGHVMLTFAVLPPLIALVVDELVVRRRWRARTAGITLGLLCTAQFFVSTEILFDMAIVLAVAVVTLAISSAIGNRRELAPHAKRAVEGAVWAVGTCALLLSFPIWYMLAGPAHISGKIQLVAQAYRADLLGPIVPDMYQLIAPASLAKIADHFASSTAENGSYLGIVLMVVLAITVVVQRRQRIVQVAAVTGIVTFVLSLGSNLAVRGTPAAEIGGLPLPDKLFAGLPLLDNAIPARFSIFTSLCAGIVLAVAMETLHDHFSRSAKAAHASARRSATAWPTTAVPIFLAAACLVLLIPTPIDGIGPTGVPTFFTSSALKRIPTGSVAVLYPYPSSAMPNGSLWQAVADFRFRQPGGTILEPGGPNGDVAFDPTTGYGVDTLTASVLIGMQQGHIPAETPALRTALRAELTSWHVRSFVAFPAGTPDPPAEVAFFTWLFARPPTALPQLTYAWFGLHT